MMEKTKKVELGIGGMAQLMVGQNVKNGCRLVRVQFPGVRFPTISPRPGDVAFPGLLILTHEVLYMRICKK